MLFGSTIRKLRHQRNLSQRDLAARVGVNYTYISKIENQKLDFGDYPSEDLVGRLAEALAADEDDFLILAGKMPQSVKIRVMERPDAFRKIAELDNKALDALLRKLDRGLRKRHRESNTKPR